MCSKEKKKKIIQMYLGDKQILFHDIKQNCLWKQ